MIQKLFEGNSYKSYRVLGLRVDDVTQSETLEHIEKFMGEANLHRIVTPNVDHVVVAQDDEEFRELVNTSSLSIPDGKWLVRGSRLVGIRLREGVAGRLLVEPICAMAAQRGWSVYILASVGDVARDAGERLIRKYPGLHVVGTRAPSMRFGLDDSETESILRELEDLRPDILFLGVGAPKSEKWIYRNRERLTSRVAIAVGYAFDVIAGRVTECPRWMTKTGTEWLYRLVIEPKRLWRRYLLRDPRFFYMLIRQRLGGKSNHWNS